MTSENKHDFIDRQAFIEDVKTEIMNLYLDGMKGTPRPRSELYDIIDRINEQPTVDAVEVVRCKDCKHFDCDYCWHDKMEHSRCREDDFCSYGERKANDTATDKTESV